MCKTCWLFSLANPSAPRIRNRRGIMATMSRTCGTSDGFPESFDRFPITGLIRVEAERFYMKFSRCAPKRILVTMALILLASGSESISAREKLRQIGIFLRCTGQEDPVKALTAVKSLGLDLIQVSKL